MRRSRGFTLVELMVALAVGGLVVLLAHRLAASVLDGIERVAAAIEAQERRANARRVLTAVVGSVDVQYGRDAFRGEPDRVAFAAWAEDGRGWTARRSMLLEARGGALVLEREHQAPLRLWDGVFRLEIDYLLDYGARERWVRRWISESSAPTALRLRVAGPERTDTLLLLIGARG